MKLALSSMRRNTQVCDTLYLAEASMSIDSLCGPCDALLQLYGWRPIESRLRKRTVQLPPFRIVLEKPQLDHFCLEACEPDHQFRELKNGKCFWISKIHGARIYVPVTASVLVSASTKPSKPINTHGLGYDSMHVGIGRKAWRGRYLSQSSE